MLVTIAIVVKSRLVGAFPTVIVTPPGMLITPFDGTYVLITTGNSYTCFDTVIAGTPGQYSGSAEVNCDVIVSSNESHMTQVRRRRNIFQSECDAQ